jgi:hypothetical protein
MPLIHTSSSINRILGSITAIEPPFWLGGEPLTTFEATELHLHWPDGVPAFMGNDGAEVVRVVRRQFRVVHDCRVLDVSLSGASVATRVKPPLGTVVVLGACAAAWSAITTKASRFSSPNSRIRTAWPGPSARLTQD